MKWIFSALTLALAFNVHAADKKLGNVVAIQRTFENAHATCTKDTQADPSFNPRAQYFACSFSVVKKNEFTPAQALLRVRADDCTIDADVKDGSLSIMYYGNPTNSNFNSASTCLRNALNANGNQDSLSFIVHAVE